MNDQTHSLLIHYLNEKHEAGMQIFIGNLADDDDTTRQKGLSAKYEFISDSFTKYGVSVLKADSEFLESLMMSTHLKMGFSEGSSFIAEYGQVQNTAVETSSVTSQEYLYTQATILMKRGLSLLLIGEYYDQDKDSEGYSLRYGPGIQYFPIQRIEFRLDLLNSRSIATVATEENLQLITQLHLWF